MGFRESLWRMSVTEIMATANFVSKKINVKKGHRFFVSKKFYEKV